MGASYRGIPLARSASKTGNVIVEALPNFRHRSGRVFVCPAAGLIGAGPSDEGYVAAIMGRDVRLAVRGIKAYAKRFE